MTPPMVRTAITTSTHNTSTAAVQRWSIGVRSVYAGSAPNRRYLQPEFGRQRCSCRSILWCFALRRRQLIWTDVSAVSGRRFACRCRFSSSVSNSGSLSGDMYTPQRSWSCTTSLKGLQITADLHADGRAMHANSGSTDQVVLVRRRGGADGWSRPQVPRGVPDLAWPSSTNMWAPGVVSLNLQTQLSARRPTQRHARAPTDADPR